MREQYGEQITAIPIESTVTRLRRQAMAAQAAWFDEPTLDRQHEYAYTLLDWGLASNNPHAIGHAKALLAMETTMRAIDEA